MNAAGAPRGRARLVPWVIAAVLLAHLAVWTAWFAFAGRHPVAEVPLAKG
ncbi:MAG TPA: hypothetical protein VHC86_13115 [Opitutaceae bacterium]|nr:hypothetical protein [Opitutaceae bacterium]